jgi:hypothetical protein
MFGLYCGLLKTEMLCERCGSNMRLGKVALLMDIGRGVAKASETIVATTKLASDNPRGLQEVN